VSALQRAQLASVTGFVVIEDGDENQRRSETLAALPDRVHVLRLSVVDQPADSDAIDRVRAVLAAYDPAIQPFVANLSARLGSDGLIRSVIVSDDLIAETPPSSALSEWLWIIAPRSTGLSIGDSTDLVVQLGGEPQSLPVRVAGLRESADVGIPLALASVLRSGSAREIELDLESDRLFLARESFRGFRLYARSIDDVSGLVSALSEAGISVIAQVQAIERVRVFDRGLTLLFIMIATIAGIGAIIAMLTNLYAAVERKQASIGHLRLLGLTRRAVAAFPVIQGLAMAAVSAALAFALAASAGATINTLVGPQLGFDRPVSALSAGSGAAAAALMLIASLIASVAAALRTLSIDPAEVMRHE
jgi:putative ABC transport system permease protein